MSHSESRAIPLGPFELVSPIGRGGMGVIWKARLRHREASGASPDLAVKVLTAERAREDAFVTAFRNEVRAVARLDHPCIVRVFEHGLVDASASRASRDRLADRVDPLVEGSPFLVMELVDGGSLAAIDVAPDWTALRALLMQLLDALAHAHARGVVHRDLKPGNVLLPRAAAAALGKLENEEATDVGVANVRLSDFGIARAGASAWAFDRTIVTSGTPHYMAPEQIEGRIRDQGPATDLYALGCLAWRLACGRPPFARAGADRQRVLVSQLHAPVPELENAIAVPPGLQTWIGDLMLKSHVDRVERAADARQRLSELGDPTVGPIRRKSAPAPAGDHTIVSGPTRHMRTTGAHLSAPTTGARHDSPIDPSRPHAPMNPRARIDPIDGNTSATVGSRGKATVPRLPALPDWRARHTRRDTRPRLMGAGLSLFGLRPVPLVGRTAERDALWRALMTACSERRPRLIVVRGSAGTGKTRLVQWLRERAHELGVANVLHAVHGTVSGPADGLGPMVARALGADGLTGEALLDRILDWLEDREALTRAYGLYTESAEILADVIDEPSGDGEHVRRKPASPQERHTAIGQLCRTLAAERGVLMWLDDVQWSRDALELSRHLLELPDSTPMLIVATLRDDDLLDLGEERVHDVETLLDHDRADELEVGPLEREAHSVLVRERLGLSGELASRVEARAAGNPLFAVQLVGDWIRRGVLEASSDGFVLADDTEAPLPDNIHAVWQPQVERVARASGLGAAREALELAATLGQHVAGEEWLALCRSVLDIDAGVIFEHLASAGLVSGTLNRFSFVHGMLRESLERMADEEGRRERHHAHCADVLEALHDADLEVVATRIARHRMSADQPEEAISLYLLAMEHAHHAGALHEVLALTAERDEALDRCDASARDPRRLRGDSIRCSALVEMGDLDAAVSLLDKFEDLPPDVPDPRTYRELQARAAYERASICRRTGDLERGRAALTRALEAWRELDDDQEIGYCLCAIGELHTLAAEHDDAVAASEAALEAFERAGDVHGQARMLIGLADIARRTSDPVRTRDLASRGLELMRDFGDRLGVARAHNLLGELGRALDDREMAEHHYRAALRLFRALGSGAGEIVRINLALVLIADERFDEARAILDATRETLENAGHDAFVACVDTVVLAPLAAESDWPAFERHVAAARAGVERTGVIDPDLAAVGEVAGDLALERHAHPAAIDAWRLALAQFDALGDADGVQRIESKIAAAGESARAHNFRSEPRHRDSE